jgi:hypothetical protein
MHLLFLALNLILRRQVKQDMMSASARVIRYSEAVERDLNPASLQSSIWPYASNATYRNNIKPGRVGGVYEAKDMGSVAPEAFGSRKKVPGPKVSGLIESMRGIALCCQRVCLLGFPYFAELAYGFALAHFTYHRHIIEPH